MNTPDPFRAHQSKFQLQPKGVLWHLRLTSAAHLAGGKWRIITPLGAAFNLWLKEVVCRYSGSLVGLAQLLCMLCISFPSRTMPSCPQW